MLPRIEMDIAVQSWIQDIGLIMQNRPFVLYTLILIGYYYLYMQMFLTIPKFAETLTGTPSSVAYVFFTISISVILFQMPVAAWLEKFPNRFTMIGVGAIIMGMGLFMFTFSSTLLSLLVNSFIFALGTMVSGPLLMDAIPFFAPKNKLASYYGFNGYSLAIGGVLSTIVGGWFYDLGVSRNWPGLPWCVCLIVASLVAWSLHSLQGKSSRTLSQV